MSRDVKRPLLLVCALALLGRWAAAWVTERRPIFPDYAYADARLFDKEAWRIASSMMATGFNPLQLTPGREVYTHGLVFLYRRLGHHPLAPKLINGLLASVSIGLWCWLALRAAPPGLKRPQRSAVALGLVLALWPTHVFYTAQNNKEALMLLLLAATFLLFSGDARPGGEERGPGWADLRPPLGAAALFVGGLLRAHLVPMAAGAILAGAAWRAVLGRRSPRALARAAWSCACLLALLAVFRPASVWILTKSMPSFEPESRFAFVTGAIVTTRLAEQTKPYTPAWIAELRRARQRSDQDYARQTLGRSVGSQIYPGLELKTWADVAAFVPRAAFTVLFMPLPGLYPMEGNLGRMLASVENLAVLALCLLAFAGLLRHGASPERAPLALFFLLFWAASSLTEVDLGGATRHRLLYLPFLLPFAAWHLEDAAALLAGKLRRPMNRTRSSPS